MRTGSDNEMASRGEIDTLVERRSEKHNNKCKNVINISLVVRNCGAHSKFKFVLGRVQQQQREVQKIGV